MLKSRVIPILLNNQDGLVKTKKFSNPNYLGDPLNAIRIFNTKCVDELILLDISRSKNNEGPNFELVQDVASECFMPLGYGGGIRNLNDAKELLSIGVEKIILQTSILQDQILISQVANFSGSQSVSISIDVRRAKNGEYSVFHAAQKNTLAISLKSLVRRVQEAGAGEIIVTSVDHEGCQNGYDLNLLRYLRSEVRVPLVMHGGAGSLHHMEQALAAGADAVAAGSLFVYYGPRNGVLISYPQDDEPRFKQLRGPNEIL